ncbi:zf-HC2 domain-containing protein [Quadrisphaera oryzae]|uniref:zf-HC2 domain-containing protein n=1 Tax=Quadrisphaera TaxID=317661 RepID=UPI00164601E3|nr:zf-HC2 domain-containing protein [Quadrisphaera sp. RL12-1S]
MISAVRTMLTCHWSARRLQRYLDADPAAPLPAPQARRLEQHLAVCRRCQQAAQESRLVKRALRGWSERQAPDPAVVRRMAALLERLTQEEHR